MIHQSRKLEGESWSWAESTVWSIVFAKCTGKMDSYQQAYVRCDPKRITWGWILGMSTRGCQTSCQQTKQQNSRLFGQASKLSWINRSLQGGFAVLCFPVYFSLAGNLFVKVGKYAWSETESSLSWNFNTSVQQLDLNWALSKEYKLWVAHSVLNSCFGSNSNQNALIAAVDTDKRLEFDCTGTGTCTF